MNAQASDDRDQTERAKEERHELLSYVWGYCLALPLTLAPFAVVRWHVLLTPTVYYLIGVLAFVQAIIHFRFFLHIGFHQKREDLALIVFSALILFILVGGTLWIMGSLAGRMTMPLHP